MNINDTFKLIENLDDTANMNDVTCIRDHGYQSFVNYVNANHNVAVSDYPDADLEIVYLVRRDWIAVERKLKQQTLFDLVCMFAGIVIDDGVIKSSPSIKVKSFGGKSLKQLSNDTDIHITTLRQWFDNKKILFHSIMLFSINQ